MTFHDLQQVENPKNGMALSSPASASDLLASLGVRDPFIFELRSEAGYTLTIGFGGAFGFVQWSAVDGAPPYMVAIADVSSVVGTRCFLAGGQQTEIPGRFCLPIERVEDIVAEFVTTGERSRSVVWEEI